MKKTKRLIAAILATLIAATLTGCNPPENESSPGVVSDTSSDVSTTESTESTEEISTVESTTGSASDDDQLLASDPTTPGDDEPTSEPTTSGDEPSSGQPSSGSQTPSSGSQTPSSSQPTTPTQPTTPEPAPVWTEPPAPERKPIDENTNIYGEKSTGGWVEMPTGTYWREGRNFYRSKEDWLYGRNPVPQGEVDGVNLDDYNIVFH